jgi:hypothetical protein
MAVCSIVSVLVLNVVLFQGDAASLQDGDRTTGPTPPMTSTGIVHAEEQSLGHGYTRRGNHIHFKGERIDQAGRETLKDFQRTLGRRVVLASDVDAATFVALSEEYTKDKNKVYFKWISPGRFWVVEIPDADPATFAVMDFSLAKDAKRVWRTDVPIKGADAATAQVVNPGWVWRDHRNVYYQFTRLDGVDPETFRHLAQGFYRDAKHAYWCTTRLKGADVNTFRTFGNDAPYAADAQHVWSADTRLANFDAGSFRLLHNHVFADKNGAYVSTRALPILGADAATLQKVAELAAGGWGFVLFRDAERLYIFDPHYAEVYTLTRTQDSVEISKPVWFGEAAGPVQHAATVAAIWKDGTLSEPEVKMQPKFDGKPKPTYEAEKLRRMTDAIREAMALEGKKPEAGKNEEGKQLQHRGDK